MWSCAGHQSGDSQEYENPLIGTWVLVKLRQGNESSWTEFPEFMRYMKHITETHFTWVHYDVEQNEVLGTGGGTYSLKGAKYTVHIEYFYPPGSNQVGTSLTFTVEIKEGNWHHSGYYYTMELDSASGDWVLGGSSYFEEVWAPY